ncbi:type I restriction-modification system subunit M [Mesorhizobium sp. CA12]|uniref:type I restriction-modification system subunit M n=1 Tax=Mesorhizobium sp. CA12 TaxID=2876644 RepID=UPI001CCD6A66|nr:type I restriction-modification system subunit M [Mesorhizobium sp. CA12]MBZ9859701.1 type I restriction-modification system subunit M [Mesorhizobium sp. CA12]
MNELPFFQNGSPHVARTVAISTADQIQGARAIGKARAAKKIEENDRVALKKSELYSFLWSSCDELRGGMDASQYKDYVLSLLFIRYISDKYADVPYAPITVPKGASFADMVALKGTADIGDQINKKIIAPLAAANQQLSQADFPDFNEASKLGDGKEKVQKLTNLIAIFEDPALDFSSNRADGDDILGDAYEYLMRHFASESGKSKGQFYTPAEVSRIMAQIIGIRQAQTSAKTTVYDPTCGSGSLLLKVADEAGTNVTLYGQEKDSATSGLARMNMILHNTPTALITQGNTLVDPKFKDGDTLKTFDYVVANPPFSDKRWSTGLDPLHDEHDRFKTFGIPPAKQGDYAYLLHIIRSLRSTGKGACILPHGVLFRGNAEAEIRRNLVRKGYIKGIIGLPANLFYGTGIPACIVVVDKEDAQARKGIFMIDASQGFMKDGPKNRLRSQDIHKIVDAFTRHTDIAGFSRMVPFAEIEKNDFNLNLPRYIDSQKQEDRQDIEGHLRGGIPQADIDALQPYWAVCPALKKALFKERRPGYVELTIEKTAIKSAIFDHPEFVAFTQGMNKHFDAWRVRTAEKLKALKPGHHPKEVIFDLSEDLLAHYTGKPLISKYDVYQHLMDYWAEVMQDDCYLIAADGWKAQTYRITEKDKKGREKDRGWACDLVPKSLIVARYFGDERAAIDEIAADLESVASTIAELEEEQSAEDGAFTALEKINRANVAARLKEIKGDKEAKDEVGTLNEWLKLSGREADLKKKITEAEAALDLAAYKKYRQLSEAEIKVLAVDDKWLAVIDARIRGEMDRISQVLAQRVRVLAERYAVRLPDLVSNVAQLEVKVGEHLKRMGFSW